MKPTRKLLVLLIAATILGTFAVTGVASGASSDQATFTLVAIPTSFEEIEGGFLFTDRVETTEGVPVEAWDGGRCINLTADPANLSQWMCELVFQLPEGNIAMAGPFDLSGETDFVFAVTGGTGAFRNVRGEVEVVPVPGYEDGRSFAIFRLLGAAAKY